MMGKIRELVKKLEQITQEAQTEALLQIVNKHQNQLIDLNLGQLFAGRDAKGFSLGRYSNDSYAQLKNLLNPTPGFGVPDLKLTGAFYAGFYLDATQFPISVNSSDSKTGKLAEQYGEVFGVDQQSLEEFRQEIKPDIQAYYRSILQLQ